MLFSISYSNEWNWIYDSNVFNIELCEGSESEIEDTDPNAGRFVRYQFTPQFLKLKTVGAT